MIAIALACGPDAAVRRRADHRPRRHRAGADPRPARRSAQDRNMSMILVTHDLGVVAGHTDEIVVMYAGQIVERAPTAGAVRRHEDALHRGAAGEHPEARRPEPHPAAGHRRAAARPDQPADGLPVLPRAARTRRTAAGPRSRRSSRPRRRATRYACWYPVGSDVWKATKARLAQAGSARSARPTSTPRGPGGRGGHARGRPDRRRPPAPTRRERLMAGTGKAHLHPPGRLAAAGRGPRRRVPGRAHRAEGQRRLGHQPRRAAGRDARPRRRVGLRQVDDRAGHHAAAPPDERLDQLRRARSSRRSTATTCAPCARTSR